MSGAKKTGLGDKKRLIGFLAAILLAGFGGSSLLAFLAARDAIRASIEGEALPAAAESIYSQLRTDLAKPVFVSSMIAGDTFLHDWVRRGEGELPAIREYLGEIVRRYGVITAFFVSDRTKRYYYEGGVLKTVSRSEPRDQWFYRVAEMKEPYELNLDPDLAHGDVLTIFINYRVVDSQGTFLGAAGVGLTVDSLRGMIERFRAEFGASIYFVDSTGAIVAGLPYGLGVAPASVRADPSLGRIAEAALASGGGSFRYMRGKEEILLRVQSLPELSWLLFVEGHEGGAVAGARRALYVNLGLCALVLCLVLLVSALTVDRFQSRLEESASRDPLTGALNRLAFEAIADHSLKSARRTKTRLSIIIFDIDEFKRVNDSLGHPAGDAVLVEVAARAQAAIRESDLLCRWGGEEFLVLLRGCGIEDAQAIAEKLRAELKAGSAASSPAEVTASAGVGELGTTEEFHALVARADRALLEAKRGGRDRTVLAREG